MLVKFLSEKSVEPYRGLVEVNGVVYANDEEKARAAGYKLLVVDEVPETKEGYYPVSYYEDTDTAVYLRWKQELLPDEEV